MFQERKIIIVVVILFTAVILAVGVLWYVASEPSADPLTQGINQPVINELVNTNQLVNLEDDNTELSGTITPPTRTDCTDELDIECWNTYRNEEYGFEFRFPVRGKVNVQKNRQASIFDVIFSLQGVSGLKDKLTVSEYGDAVILSFFIYNSGGKNITDWLKDQLPKFDILEKRYINEHHIELWCGKCESLDDLSDFGYTALDFISDSRNNFVMNYGGFYDSHDFLDGPSNQVPAKIVSTFKFSQ